MINIDQALTRLHQTAVVSPADSESVLSTALMDLTRQFPVYGQLLVQLSRWHEATISTLFAIAWRDHQLGLIVNDANWDQSVNATVLMQQLIHISLHLLWGHPIRYADEAATMNVTIATDVTVNQALPNALPGTWTLAALEQQVGHSLPANADSSVYLRALNEQTQRGDALAAQNTAGAPSLDRHEHATQNEKAQLAAPTKRPQLVDDHDSWATFTTNSNQAEGQLAQLVQETVAHTTARQRGQLPSTVQTALQRTSPHTSLPWAALFARLVGRLPEGKQVSQSRFNRRQPQRMELPGTLTRLTSQVVVFVDESASIDASTLARLLDELVAIVSASAKPVFVTTFDAAVGPMVRVVAGKLAAQAVMKTRRAGGGTRYQAIFDTLVHDPRRTQNDLVIILTDGAGERRLNDHGFHQVTWVLTGTQALSITSPPGVVVRLTDMEAI
ncbi:VWA-like domain-containing protein [Furfurilactobacillus entadae]|uniref:VWA-like domain-containing protein n=1 Tax=Furfurilactobacillus entadae TaxID=2922307 RepID=UPI0035EAF443